MVRADDSRQNRAKHGLMRALLANMVKGVTEGWTRELEINGVGYRAEVTGETLTLALGYSHPVVFKLPKGVGAKVDKNTDRARPAPTATCSARPPRRSASSARPSPTRARASSTPKKSSSGRSARPARPAAAAGKYGCRTTDDHGQQEQAQSRKKRHRSTPQADRGTAERPRLSVFRSARHIYAQVIDDLQQKTLVAASDLAQGKQARRGGEQGRKAPRRATGPSRSGAAIAKKCLAKGIDKVVFDRNGYNYHGRVTALADGAREAGLKF